MSSQNAPARHTDQNARKSLVELVQIARDGGVATLIKGSSDADQAVIAKVHALLGEAADLLKYNMGERMEPKMAPYAARYDEFARVVDAMAK